MAWAGLGLLAVVAAFFAGFGATNVAVQAGLGAGESSAAPRWDLAIGLFAFGSFGLIGLVVAGRLAFGSWPVVSRAGITLALIGVLLAAAFELALHEWARLHIGQYDVDYVWPTAILSALLVLSGLSTFAVLLVPSSVVPLTLVSLGLVTVAATSILASNVPGSFDGIEPESWPISWLMAAGAAYIVVAASVGTLRLRRREGLPEENPPPEG